jgi:FkbM family methyltransferase
MQAVSASLPQISLHEKSGLWWPTDCDADAGFEYMIRRVTDVDVAIRECRKTALCVQAGGNIGMWPLRLAKTFSCVHTFEPVPHIYGALCRNVLGVPGIITHNELLSDVPGRVVPFSVRPGGVSRVVLPDDPRPADVMHRATTIDALNLPCCDAIFLDVEGHELEALGGAAQTITRFQPIITVEVWEANMEVYLALFDKLGYDRVEKVHGDYIFAPR